MQIFTRARTAVTALIDMALANQRVTPVREVAARINISISYLEPMFSKMREEGLVVSIRGQYGGYRIAKPLQDILVSDIVLAVDSDGPIRTNATTRGGICLAQEMWASMDKQILHHLGKVTLAELVFAEKRRREKAN